MNYLGYISTMAYALANASTEHIQLYDVIYDFSIYLMAIDLMILKCRIKVNLCFNFAFDPHSWYNRANK